MNHLSLRNGPEFQFILEPHRLKFESRVIEVYLKAAENLTSKAPIPEVERLFDYVQLDVPEQFIAAYLGNKHDNPNYFFELTGGCSDAEAFDLSKRALEQYNRKIEPKYDELFYFDLAEVLNFHHMSFLDFPDPYNYIFFNKGKDSYYKNIPINQVW